MPFPIDPLPAVFGAALFALGAGAAWLHRRGLDRMEDRADRGELEEWERNFHRARHRRRRKVAGLLMFLGVAIPAGDAALVALGPAANPWMPAYLFVLLWGVSGLFLLAALDWWATVSHTRDRVADVRARRAALEYELKRLRADLARPAEPVEPPEPRRTPPRNRLRDYSFDD